MISQRGMGRGEHAVSGGEKASFSYVFIAPAPSPPPPAEQLNLPAEGDYFAQIIYSASQRSLAMHKILCCSLSSLFAAHAIPIRHNLQSFKVNISPGHGVVEFSTVGTDEQLFALITLASVVKGEKLMRLFW